MEQDFSLPDHITGAECHSSQKQLCTRLVQILDIFQIFVLLDFRIPNVQELAGSLMETDQSLPVVQVSKAYLTPGPSLSFVIFEMIHNFDYFRICLICLS